MCCVCACAGASNFCAHVLLILSPVHQVGAAGPHAQPLGPSISSCRPSLLHACSSHPCTDARQVCAPVSCIAPNAPYLPHLWRATLFARSTHHSDAAHPRGLPRSGAPAGISPPRSQARISAPVVVPTGERRSRQAAGEPQRLPHLLRAHTSSRHDLGTAKQARFSFARCTSVQRIRLSARGQ